MFGEREEDPSVEDDEEDEWEEVDEEDVDSSDGVLEVLGSSSSVGAEENGRTRSSSRRGLSRSQPLPFERRRGFLSLGSRGLDWDDDGRSGTESESERSSVEVLEEDPNELRHRDRNDQSPAKDTDGEHQRCDDEEEERPVGDSTEPPLESRLASLSVDRREKLVSSAVGGSVRLSSTKGDLSLSNLGSFRSKSDGGANSGVSVGSSFEEGVAFGGRRGSNGNLRRRSGRPREVLGLVVS